MMKTNSIGGRGGGLMPLNSRDGGNYYMFQKEYDVIIQLGKHQ